MFHCRNIREKDWPNEPHCRTFPLKIPLDQHEDQLPFRDNAEPVVCRSRAIRPPGRSHEVVRTVPHHARSPCLLMTLHPNRNTALTVDQRKAWVNRAVDMLQNNANSEDKKIAEAWDKLPEDEVLKQEKIFLGLYFRPALYQNLIELIEEHDP